MAHKKVKYFDLNNYDITNNEKKFEFLVVGTTQGYFRGLIEEWSPSCNLTIHSTLPLRQEVQANVIKCRDKRSGMTLSITIQKTGFNDLRNRGSECGGRLQSRKAQPSPASQPGQLLGPSVTSRGETSRHLLVKTTPGFLFIVQEIHTGDFPRGVGHRVENGWVHTKVAVVLLNGLIW